MIKTEKILHLKSSRGRKVRVVREHYLRERVPCCSCLCQAACDNDGKVLPGDLTHYVVPDAAVVVDYLEILEFRELQGVVFTQTACQAVQHSKGRRQYNRLRNLLKDPRHDCVLFANEFQEYSYCPREKGESQEQWQTRCVYSAAVWYHNHLAGMMDIVMITEDRDAIAQYGSLNAGVYVISVQDFLRDFWPQVQAAHELYTSISQALQEKESEASQKTSQRILAVPWDRRIPKIRISTQQADALQDHRVVVRIDSWESTSLYPNGHSVRVLGPAGELETEVQTILIENGIHVAPFSDAQLREMPVNSPEKPWTIDPAQAAERRDLRESHLVFSIDPRGCEDVDDTLSVRSLPGGKLLELGVHIADVTHFVTEGSLTDLEARLRATTYYLADRRYDMLPAVLSADLCSLLGGVDRYAMSVMWELDAHTLAVNKVWYGRTIIRSSYQLHYELAQALLNGEEAEVPELSELGPEEKDAKLAELTQALEMLTHVARQLRAQRDRGGALELEGVEVRAQLDEQRNITALVPRQPLEVHETVAECMIYANHWVARKIQETFPHQALLRRHPPPRQEFFSQLVDSAKASGFAIDTRTNKALADSLDQAMDPQDPLVNRLLRMMATAAMSQALYFSTGLESQDQFYHYGLALDRYTHFTSPIRRYADIVVHRLLTAAIDLEREAGLGRTLANNKELEEMAQHINNKNMAAQRAQKSSTALFQCLYFKERDPQTDPSCVADAVIYSIRNNGILVFVPEYGVKGPVYMKNRDGQVVAAGPDGSCEWQSGSVRQHSDHISTTSSCGTSTFRLFDHITVRISVHSAPFHGDSLNLEVVSNRPHRSPEPQQTPSQGRSQLVQEVVRLAEEASQQAQEKKAAQRPKLSKEEREFRQSKTPNLYSLLEEVRELALMDLDTAAQVCATTA